MTHTGCSFRPAVHAEADRLRRLRSGTCIETGWAVSDGWTLAQVTTGYHEGQVTRAGVSFARFLMSLGVQGNFELGPSPPGHKP